MQQLDSFPDIYIQIEQLRYKMNHYEPFIANASIYDRQYDHFVNIVKANH